MGVNSKYLDSVVENGHDHPLNERIREVSSFKDSFDVQYFLESCRSNGLLDRLNGIVDVNKRLNEFVESYWKLSSSSKIEVNFAGFVVNVFQREMGIDLGMCNFLEISLGESSYIRSCSVSGIPVSVSCSGFRKDYCWRFQQSKHL